MGLCGFLLIRTCGDDMGQQSLAFSTILEDDLKLCVHWKICTLGVWMWIIIWIGYEISCVQN